MAHHHKNELIENLIDGLLTLSAWTIGIAEGAILGPFIGLHQTIHNWIEDITDFIKDPSWIGALVVLLDPLMIIAIPLACLVIGPVAGFMGAKDDVHSFKDLFLAPLKAVYDILNDIVLPYHNSAKEDFSFLAAIFHNTSKNMQMGIENSDRKQKIKETELACIAFAEQMILKQGLKLNFPKEILDSIFSYVFAAIPAQNKEEKDLFIKKINHKIDKMFKHPHIYQMKSQLFKAKSQLKHFVCEKDLSDIKKFKL